MLAPRPEHPAQSDAVAACAAAAARSSPSVRAQGDGDGASRHMGSLSHDEGFLTRSMGLTNGNEHVMTRYDELLYSMYSKRNYILI